MPDFSTIAIRKDLLAVRELLLRRECTPRILVVADGLDFNASNDFGLSEFVAALRAAKVHGHTPIVTTAYRGPGAGTGADIAGFDFVSGLTKTYDVMFLFAAERAAKDKPGVGSNLPQAEVDAIAAFMAAGKGVFATGDHEDLGAAMCGNLPRIRQMRLWFNEDGAPPADTDKRNTTNSPGADGMFVFADQSDELPQKIYPRYYQTAPGVSAPHALLQAPSLTVNQTWQPIEVAPDHPHEGECVVPGSLVTPATIGTLTIDEWPAVAGVRPAPEVIAFGMNYGGAFPGKDAIRDPRAFGVIGAYDGHQGGVGRVAVDSTWHHFININIDGTGTSQQALKPGGVASPSLKLLYAYWQNLATWLMPRNVRRCLLLARVAELVLRYPLIEELPRVPWPPPGPDPVPDLGRRVIAELRRLLPPGEAATMVADLRAAAFGRDVDAHGDAIDEAAVGAVVGWLRGAGTGPAALAERIGDPHKLEPRLAAELRPTLAAAITRVRAKADERRAITERLDEVHGRLLRTLG